MVEIREVSESGSSGASKQTVLDLKSDGNNFFKEKEFEKALVAYEQALAFADDTDIALKSALKGNMALVFYHLNRLDEALVSCREAQELDQSSAKLLAREATILAEMGEFSKAKHAVEKATHQFPGERKSLLRTLSAVEKKEKKAKSKLESGIDGFFNRSKTSLYSEKPVASKTEVEAQFRAAKNLLEKLKSSLGGNDSDLQHMSLMNGLFKRLMDPKEFRKIVYNGMEVLEEQMYLPNSFAELLENEIYSNALVALFPKIRQRADVVLENVKKAGMKEGDFMDEHTESRLRPQILNEAFAFEVVSMIQELNRRQNSFLSQSKEFIASPDAEEARANLLAEATVNDLMNDDKGFAVQENFLDDNELEWQHFLEEDTNNILAVKSDLDEVTGRRKKGCADMFECWLHKNECMEKYPAIAYLVEQLELLPFEINRKSSLMSKASLNLCKLSDSHIFLQVFRSKAEGKNPLSEEVTLQGQEPRLDGTRGKDDNGLKLSATYFFSSNWNDGFDNKGKTSLIRNNKKVAEIAPIADRLVLYRSRQVMHSVEQVILQEGMPPKRRLSITVFFNGPEADSWSNSS